MNDIALVCVTHDIEGKNVILLNEVGHTLKSIYNEVYITISDETSHSLHEALLNYQFNVNVIPKKGVAHARREGLKFGYSGNHSYYHYCDFDRMLVWAKYYKDELFELKKRIKNNHYTILGRTKEAFLTHPKEWIETEKITNKIFSLEIGFESDVTAGACGLSRESAELILKHSKDVMTDAEWPMIVKRIGKLDVEYHACDGLQYVSDINGVRRMMTESDAWFTRLKLSYIISESARYTGK